MYRRWRTWLEVQRSGILPKRQLPIQTYPMPSTCILLPYLYNSFLRPQRHSAWRSQMQCVLKHWRPQHFTQLTPSTKNEYYKAFECKQDSHVFYKPKYTVSSLESALEFPTFRVNCLWHQLYSIHFIFHFISVNL